MKKLSLLLFVAVLIFSGCVSRYTTDKGSYLTQYYAPENLKELIDSGMGEIRLIDVRPSSSYNNGHIPQAESYPSSEIMSRLDELPKDTPYIVYCETGGRAQAVIKMLEKENYTTLMNWGGYTRWPYDLVTE